MLTHEPSLSHAHAHLNYLSVFYSQTKHSLWEGWLQSLWNGQINIPLTHTVLLDQSPHYTLQAWLKHGFVFTDQQWKPPLQQKPVSTLEKWNNFKTLLKTVILMKFIWYHFKLKKKKKCRMSTTMSDPSLSTFRWFKDTVPFKISIILRSPSEAILHPLMLINVAMMATVVVYVLARLR